MAAIDLFGPMTPEREAIIRQRIVDSLNRKLQSGRDLANFPITLRDAMKKRIWEKDRMLATGGVVPPMDFNKFVTEDYPRGLGVDHATIRRLISGEPEVMGLYDAEVQRDAGNPNPRDPKTGRLTPIVDNIHNRESDPSAPDRPTGTSSQAGLRRLRKAADEGDARARQQLDNVMSGETSVHAACVELGWRKKTVTLQDEPVVLFNAAVAKAGPLETAQRAWRMMSQEDKAKLLDWLSSN